MTYQEERDEQLFILRQLQDAREAIDIVIGELIGYDHKHKLDLFRAHKAIYDMILEEQK